MKGDAGRLNLMAEKLVLAQRHCYNKSKQMVTGERLSDAVRRVASNLILAGRGASALILASC